MSDNRTTISRLKHRSLESREAVYRVLDEGLVCFVGFIRENYPVVLPMSYARCGDELVLHGGYGSPFAQAIVSGNDICITVALVDGLVLAKSATNHSVNYRSVVVFGKAKEISVNEEKKHYLKALINHTIPGRWDVVREPSQRELDGTMVMTVPIAEYSAKMRDGDATTLASDENIPVWSGVLPLELKACDPLPDKFSTRLDPGLEIWRYRRRK